MKIELHKRDKYPWSDSVFEINSLEELDFFLRHELKEYRRETLGDGCFLLRAGVDSYHLTLGNLNKFRNRSGINELKQPIDTHMISVLLETAETLVETLNLLKVYLKKEEE